MAKRIEETFFVNSRTTESVRVAIVKGSNYVFIYKKIVAESIGVLVGGVGHTVRDSIRIRLCGNATNAPRGVTHV